MSTFRRRIMYDNRKEYEPVEWICNNNAAYFDTGVKLSSSIKWEAVYMTDFASYIFGAFDGRTYYGLRRDTDTTMRWHCGQVMDFYFVWKGDTFYDVVADGSKVYIDGDLKADASTNAVYPDLNLYAFTRNRGSNGTDGFWDAVYCKRIKIWDNGILIRDYIPVKRTFDGEYGMLDQCANKFYTSDNNAKFIGGGNDMMISGYADCTYIGSDGSSYIDTGIAPKFGLRAEFYYKANRLNGSQNLLASRSGDLIFNMLQDHCMWEGLCAGVYSQWGSIAGHCYKPNNVRDWNFYTITIADDSIAELVYDDKVTRTFSGTKPLPSSLTQLPLYLFGCNLDGEFARGINGKIKGVVIKDITTGEILRNYVPKQRISDGIYGLYDMIEKKFFPSASTTPFTGGIE